MSDDADSRNEQRLARVHTVLATGVPHNRALGIEFSEFGDGRAAASLPYDDRFVGNPETGVLHGGVITALLDSTCGAAVFAKLVGGRQARIATLDLRIDYLRAATPGERVRSRAECYKMTKHMAFVRGIAFHEDEADPIATATGGFMVFSREAEAREAKDKGGGA